MPTMRVLLPSDHFLLRIVTHRRGKVDHAKIRRDLMETDGLSVLHLNCYGHNNFVQAADFAAMNEPAKACCLAAWSSFDDKFRNGKRSPMALLFSASLVDDRAQVFRDVGKNSLPSHALVSISHIRDHTERLQSAIQIEERLERLAKILRFPG